MLSAYFLWESFELFPKILSSDFVSAIDSGTVECLLAIFSAEVFRGGNNFREGRKGFIFLSVGFLVSSLEFLDSDIGITKSHRFY